MTTLKIENFAGIAPRWSNRLLPNNGAVAAENCKLLSGECRGLRETQLIYDFGNANIARAYRLPATVGAPLPLSGADNWVGFTVANVDFVRTPVLEDAYERYYWTGDTTAFSGAPQYNTRARIDSSTASFVLGIPAPVGAPAIAPASGGTPETRSYIYTFVSAYGEEGAPSPATVASGNSVGTWSITGMDSTVSSPTNYNLSLTRIYRTVAGDATASYYHVADVSFGTTSYSDSAADTTIAENYTCLSLTWDPPPATLQGLVAHPGGFLVGFSGRDLYMSQPYQAHAWPVENILTCQTEIVGLAVWQNILVVTTTSHMYYGEGMSPQAMTLQKLDSIDPCLNKRSIAVTVNGVYYASPQGIVMFNGGTTQLATFQLFTREEWQNFFSPTTVQMVPYGVQLVAFDSTASGFIYSPSEQLAPLTTIDRFTAVTAIQIDAYSGDVYLIQGGQVRLWDPPTSTPYSFTWESKEFDLPKPVNFGAMRLKFTGGGYQIPTSLLGDYTSFNDQRIAFPLNPINGMAINGVRTAPAVPGGSGVITGAGTIVAQNKNPIGGSPLWNLPSLSNVNGGVQVTVLARDLQQNWNVIFDYAVSTEGIYRLPAGFKSDGWQIRLIGNIPIYSVVLAETGKELQQV
jgi:hypothetical protein